ncbi:glycosyltransferase [Mycobacterium sp. M1]|uniref:Glycosyltransferase n=2 Tax=Mycolicibacter acidiphilus TaxID=2835306 RepID=A0ABS5RMR5_9MYCO|nr:glycosyltransferase [Mycolicibacter acidiphilus]
MWDAPDVRPTICLNMIVRNEAHVIREALDSVAPHIASWVIVDTGSDDGTQNLIKGHMADLGIPGELHERPWRDFGHNRSEALELARGHADYIWVIDADDVLNGVPDFTGLSADVYYLRYRSAASYWRRQLFRSDLPWRYEGVVHEYPVCDEPITDSRLAGEYHVHSRRLGARNKDDQKYARDRDLLLAEVQRNPGDARSVFYLARSYFDLGDFDNAREWFARRAAMGGWAEEVYYSMFQGAQAMDRSGARWPDVQDAYLRAWEFRPTRAEALNAVAHRYRIESEYQLGHLFAEQAARIPFPEDDMLFVDAGAYQWRCRDEQAICASRLGNHGEALSLCRQLIASPDLPPEQRQRVAKNRDFSVPAMLQAALAYPAELAQQTVGRGGGDVTVSMVAGEDRSVTERALNSFLNCCLDVSRVDRFLVAAAGLAAADQQFLARRYPFLEFIPVAPAAERGECRALIRARVSGRLWLHLEGGRRFFAPENYLGRLSALLAAEPEVVQVGVNFADADELTGVCAAEDVVRRASGAGRYVVVDSVVTGPAMFDLDRLSRIGDAHRDPVEVVRERTDIQVATLDEVLCVVETAADQH